jgi:hypothetical protein
VREYWKAHKQAVYDVITALVMFGVMAFIVEVLR